MNARSDEIKGTGSSRVTWLLLLLILVASLDCRSEFFTENESPHPERGGGNSTGRLCAAHRDQSRELRRLKAQVEPLLT